MCKCDIRVALNLGVHPPHLGYSNRYPVALLTAPFDGCRLGLSGTHSGMVFYPCLFTDTGGVTTKVD